MENKFKSEGQQPDESAADLANVKLEPDSEPDSEYDTDETLQERICGLGEMFPKTLRNQLGSFWRFLSNLYQSTCDASWLFFILLAIAAGPALIEIENQRENQKLEDKKCLSEHPTSHNS